MIGFRLELMHGYASEGAVAALDYPKGVGEFEERPSSHATNPVLWFWKSPDYSFQRVLFNLASRRFSSFMRLRSSTRA